MRVHDLSCYRIGDWLPNFEHLSYKTSLINLPADFVEFLLADGVKVSSSSAAVS